MMEVIRTECYVRIRVAVCNVASNNSCSNDRSGREDMFLIGLTMRLRMKERIREIGMSIL